MYGLWNNTDQSNIVLEANKIIAIVQPEMLITLVYLLPLLAFTKLDKCISKIV